jgi:hypothetical protein
MSLGTQLLADWSSLPADNMHWMPVNNDPDACKAHRLIATQHCPETQTVGTITT